MYQIKYNIKPHVSWPLINYIFSSERIKFTNVHTLLKKINFINKFSVNVKTLSFKHKVCDFCEDFNGNGSRFIPLVNNDFV